MICKEKGTTSGDKRAKEGGIKEDKWWINTIVYTSFKLNLNVTGIVQAYTCEIKVKKQMSGDWMGEYTIGENKYITIVNK